MVRDLIQPGEKQIKALLSPACCHTIAYINILSWVIQVSKGLIHLHFHKGPLSTLWPPSHLPLPPTSTCRPLLHLTGPPPFTFPPPSIHLAVSAIIPIITIELGALQYLNPLRHRWIACWQTMQRRFWKAEVSWHLWKHHNDLWTRAWFKPRLRHFTETLNILDRNKFGLAQVTELLF